MEKKFTFNNELNELLESKNDFDEEFNDEEIEELDGQRFYQKGMNLYLNEVDFYPISDKRVWTSNVEDIDGGDNFADYCAEFFEMLDEEGYYDN